MITHFPLNLFKFSITTYSILNISQNFFLGAIFQVPYYPCHFLFAFHLSISFKFFIYPVNQTFLQMFETHALALA